MNRVKKTGKFLGCVVVLAMLVAIPAAGPGRGPGPGLGASSGSRVVPAMSYHQLPLNFTIKATAFRDGTAYAVGTNSTSGYAFLAIVDVSTPRAPRLCGQNVTYHANGLPTSVQVRLWGDFAFISTSRGFFTVNVTDPGRLVFQYHGTCHEQMGHEGEFDLEWPLLYTHRSSFDGEIVVLNVSDPGAFTNPYNITYDYEWGEVDVVGDVLYHLERGDDHFNVFNLTSEEITRFTLPGNGGSGDHLVVNGSLVYVSIDERCYQYDASDPGAVVELAQVPLGGTSPTLGVYASYVYTWYHGFEFYDFDAGVGVFESAPFSVGTMTVYNYTLFYSSHTAFRVADLPVEVVETTSLPSLVAWLAGNATRLDLVSGWLAGNATRLDLVSGWLEGNATFAAQLLDWVSGNDTILYDWLASNASLLLDLLAWSEANATAIGAVASYLSYNATRVDALVTWTEGNATLVDAVMGQVEGNSSALLAVVDWLAGNQTETAATLGALFTRLSGNATLLEHVNSWLGGNATLLQTLLGLVSGNSDILTRVQGEVGTLTGDVAALRAAVDLLNVTVSDADLDGLDDLEELVTGTLVNVTDTDGDGLSDGLERRLGTNPLLPDTDGDGFSDMAELAGGWDPLDSANNVRVTLVVVGVVAAAIASPFLARRAAAAWKKVQERRAGVRDLKDALHEWGDDTKKRG